MPAAKMEHTMGLIPLLLELLVALAHLRNGVCPNLDATLRIHAGVADRPKRLYQRGVDLATKNDVGRSY